MDENLLKELEERGYLEIRGKREKCNLGIYKDIFRKNIYTFELENSKCMHQFFKYPLSKYTIYKVKK